ncbi:MAG TPA: hypothetical protein VGL56_13175 [Fimbriimonadaceae bacterium]
MPRGDKSKYTDRQKRMAEHIEEGYEKHGVGEKEAESRAWATVNKTTHGGEKKGGGGYGKSEDHSPEVKGGKIGGAHSHSGSKGRTPTHNRSEAAKLGWETRRKNEKS